MPTVYYFVQQIEQNDSSIVGADVHYSSTGELLPHFILTRALQVRRGAGESKKYYADGDTDEKKKYFVV